MSGFYPSAKMGVTIQFESHRSELPAVFSFEHDHQVLEYYDQAWVLKLVYKTAEGRPVGCLHTPDFFVIGEYCGWVECKTEKDLRKLAEEMPHRYVREADGSWRCPPGEVAAGKLGLDYKVFVADRMSSELNRNLIFLDDYYLRAYEAPPKQTVNKVLEVVKHQQGIIYPELLAKVPELTPDDLNYLISRGIVYTDLRSVLLVDRESVTIYTDSVAARAAAAAAQAEDTPVAIGGGRVDLAPTARLVWRGKEHIITHVDDTLVKLLAPDGGNVLLKRTDLELEIAVGRVSGITPSHAREQVVVNAFTQAGPERLRVAVDRWQTISPILNGTRRLNDVPKHRRRTVKRWLIAYRRSQQSYGNGFIGLIPKDRPGNRQVRFCEPVDGLMAEVITKVYEAQDQLSVSAAYGILLSRCQKLGLPAPSLKTFGNRVRMRPQCEQVRKTKGHRAAQQIAKFYFFLDQTTPVHGDRPWEIGHIDHTLLDIELVCPRTGTNLGRPWLTLLIDARTRRILAIHVSLFAESAEACMMVLRECVRRHQRLPQTLVVDHGKAFDSLYFETLLANYQITKKSRPPAQPRFGSVCERLFGTINTQFIHNLRGNTKLTKNVRQVTASHAPRNLAVWTLDELHERLKDYCYDVYDTNSHVALGQSPRDEMASLLAETGSRQHVFIPYDGVFQILTLPTTPSGAAKVHYQKGIHINYLDYWNEVFREPKVAGTEVPIRFDPWDASTAYAFVNGAWVTCISRNALVFKNWSQKAVELASELLRARYRAEGKKRQVTMLRLAKFLEETKSAEEEAALQILRAKEVSSRGAERLVTTAAPADSVRPRPASPTTSASPAGDVEPANNVTQVEPVSEIEVIKE